MIRTLVVAVCLALLVVSQGNAQTTRRKPVTKRNAREKTDELPANIIKLNPLSLFTVTTSLAYQRVIDEKMSGQVGFFYTFPSVTIADTQFQGFGITPEYRFYLLDVPAPRGLYVGPYLRYQRFRLSYDDLDSDQYDGKATFRALGFGGLVGGQWVFGNGFSIDAFFGLAITGFNTKVDVPQVREKVKIPIAGSVAPRFGITLGMGW